MIIGKIASEIGKGFNGRRAGTLAITISQTVETKITKRKVIVAGLVFDAMSED